MSSTCPRVSVSAKGGSETEMFHRGFEPKAGSETEMFHRGFEPKAGSEAGKFSGIEFADERVPTGGGQRGRDRG
jgi:hypothetical protein